MSSLPAPLALPPTRAGKLLLEQCDKPSLFQVRRLQGGAALISSCGKPITSQALLGQRCRLPGCRPALPCSPQNLACCTPPSILSILPPQAITFSSASRFEIVGSALNITQSSVNAL